MAAGCHPALRRNEVSGVARRRQWGVGRVMTRQFPEPIWRVTLTLTRPTAMRSIVLLLGAECRGIDLHQFHLSRLGECEAPKELSVFRRLIFVHHQPHFFEGDQ